jgi:hypothetical protein
MEIMFKDQETEEQKLEREKPSDSYEKKVKQRLVTFSKKPWVIPDFLKIQRPMFIGQGDIIPEPLADIAMDD